MKPMHSTGLHERYKHTDAHIYVIKPKRWYTYQLLLNLNGLLDKWLKSWCWCVHLLHSRAYRMGWKWSEQGKNQASVNGQQKTRQISYYWKRTQIALCVCDNNRFEFAVIIWIIPNLTIGRNKLRKWRFYIMHDFHSTTLSLFFFLFYLIDYILVIYNPAIKIIYRNRKIWLWNSNKWKIFWTEAIKSRQRFQISIIQIGFISL